MGPLAIAAAIAVATLLAGSARAQEASQEALVKRFAGVAGGWYLEQRCQRLAAPERREFDWHAEQINIALASRLPDELRLATQREADRQAERIECGGDAEGLIRGAFEWSRELSFELVGRPYSAGAALISQAQRLGSLYRAQALDDRCGLMPADVRARFDDDVAELGRRLDEATGGRASRRMKELSARLSSSRAAPECGEAALRYLKTAETEARWAVQRQSGKPAD